MAETVTLSLKPIILAVEDEPDLGELLVDLLSDDFTVDHCVDPRKAMDHLKLKNYDCMMTDLAMPHLSGKQLVELVKKEFPNLPIIVMSGRVATDPEVKAVMRLGCVDILTKPLPSPEDIITAVKKAIATR